MSKIHLPDHIKALFAKAGRKGGRAKTEKKTAANRANALKRWAKKTDA